MTDENAKYIAMTLYIRPDQKRDLELLARLESVHGIQSYLRRAADAFLTTHPLWSTIQQEAQRDLSNSSSDL